MHKNQITAEDINILRDRISLFGNSSEDAKTELIESLKKKLANKVSILLKYEECLLFIAAYPDSGRILSLANDELSRLNDLTHNILTKAKENKQNEFSASGFLSTYFIGSFSHPMCVWLKEEFPNCIRFHSFGESERLSQELLSLSLFPSETWLTENMDIHVNKWIEKASGYKIKDSLDWILKATSKPELTPVIRDMLFDSLQLFVSIEIKEEKNARSLLRSPKGKFYYHDDGLKKKISITEILAKNIPKPIRLTEKEKSEYIRVSRFTLLHLSRETDPVSYCRPDGIEVFDLDRGLSIALFHLPHERRNAIDSYIGYMVFKNRIPCAYGGAWVFGNKAKIGLNIFSAFRGGESSFIFAQIIRLYKKRFRLRYFEAEPYQIGMGNPEGIDSGAFWFYYKLGFRPHQEDLRALSATEFNKIKSDKTYRTEKQTLRKLAHSFLFLDTLRPDSALKDLLPDGLNISQVISGIISDQFKGDRSAAMKFFDKEIRIRSRLARTKFKKQDEKEVYNSILPLLYILCSMNGMNKKDSYLIEQLVKTKAEPKEFNFTQVTRKIQTRLSKALMKFRNNSAK
jgi:hypothetical protein